MFTVTCCSRGNPDFKQDPNRPISPREVHLFGGNMTDACHMVRDYIKAWDLGGGNWVGEAGEVHDEQGKLVGRISYNGQFWRHWTEEEVKIVKPALEIWVDGRVIVAHIVGKPGPHAKVLYNLNGEREIRDLTWDAILRHLNQQEALYA